MSNVTWWVAALAFSGALVGAAIPAWVSLRQQRQTARTEWRARFDRAIDLATSRQRGERVVGDELLADLVHSDLGPDADRALARRVSSILIAHREGTAIDVDGPEGDNGGSSEHDRWDIP